MVAAIKTMNWVEILDEICAEKLTKQELGQVALSKAKFIGYITLHTAEGKDVWASCEEEEFKKLLRNLIETKGDEEIPNKQKLVKLVFELSRRIKRVMDDVLFMFATQYY